MNLKRLRNGNSESWKKRKKSSRLHCMNTNHSDHRDEKGKQAEGTEWENKGEIMVGACRALKILESDFRRMDM